MSPEAEGRHRGADPEDASAFGPESLPRLRLAVEEVSWLLSRGYPMSAASAVAGNQRGLDGRQRLAVQRASCSEAQRMGRAARACAPGDLLGASVSVDGWNLLVTLECALGGAVTHLGVDGALRDLAGLRGSYRVVEETSPALDLAGEALAALGVARVEWLFDAPVSNSGRVRALLLERASAWPFETEVALVPDPDPVLSERSRVVTSDALILDRCGSWIGLARRVVERSVPRAWVVDLGPGGGAHSSGIVGA